MSNELTVISPNSINEAQSLAKTLSLASILPDALRRNEADILATILAGSELGLPPMTALRGIQIIQGKPTLAADTMGALVKRRKEVCQWLSLVESTPKSCTYKTQRIGDPEPTSMTWTFDQAVTAGLTGGMGWKKYPDAMLRARCLAAICRAVYPDVCMGLYDPDELGAPSEPPRETIEVVAKPSKTEQVREQLKAKQEAAKEVAPVVADVQPELPAAYAESMQNMEPPQDIPLPVSSPPVQRKLEIQDQPNRTWTVPIGKNKGKTLSQLELGELKWLAKAFRENAADPKKKRWEGEALANLKVVEDELIRLGD